MADRRGLSGKTAIITGGASGIGAALGRTLAKRGVDVVLADRQIDMASEAADELRTAGLAATSAELDVRDLGATKALVDRTIARTGGVDFFFANAGIGIAGEMADYGPADWDDVFDVNLRGVAYGVQAVYPHMVSRGTGHFIATASMAGLVSAAGEASYTASKHGVVGLAKALRVEGRRHGVRSSVLCPGAIRTPILTGGKYGRFNIEGLSRESIDKLWALTRPMNVDLFAEKALAAILANEHIIVLPRWWKALWYLERVSPAASTLAWQAVLAKMRKDIEKLGGKPTKG